MLLRTLGGLELQDSGFTRPKPLLLLGYLALEGGRDRRHIGELFFAQAKDRMNSLRTTLMRLRQEVPGVLEADGDPLRASVECDAQRLLSNLESGELELATAHYTGSFMAGVHLPDWSIELEEWVFTTREFIASRVRSALLTLAEREASRSDFTSAAQLAERACWLEGAPDPEPEEFLRLGALFTAGQSPFLGRLRDQAKGFEIDLNFSLEEARQKFLEPRPETSSRSSLPTRGTTFVGRSIERPQIENALARSDVRLLSLIGPGGIGKTRLALEIAQASRITTTVAFVSLEAITTLTHLPNAIASILGLQLGDDPDPFQAVVKILEKQNLLLILDSVEHLLEGANYLPDLLRGCPNLKLLITSRERLGLEEEWVFHVGGLAIPTNNVTLEQALGFEAVQLFAQRAKRAQLSFNLTPDKLEFVLKICELVGGSPLGLELAAAWVRLMPTAEIADEIAHNLDFLEAANTDIPAKHQSLRAVFEQTWKRLNTTEQRVLARLTVFRGGFTREAANEVSGANLSVLSSLLDKSLIRVSDKGRYDIHVLLHQFALEMLSKNVEDFERTRVAHGNFFFAFCQRAGTAIRQMIEEKRWTERVDQDLENIRAALTEWLERDDTETALKHLTILRNFWSRTGRAREARDWFSKALHQVGNTSDLGRENALTVYGEIAMMLGNYLEAQVLLEESLALSNVRGIERPLTLLHLGLIAQETLNFEVARTRFEQALVGFREKGIVQGIASSLNNLGSIQMFRGDLEQALATFQEALHYKIESGGDVDSVLINLGVLQHRLGNLKSAQKYLLQALKGLIERGFHIHIPNALENLGKLAAMQEHPESASVLFGAALIHRETMNSPIPLDERELLEIAIANTRSALGEEAFDIAWSEGRAMTFEQAVAYAVDTFEK
jgi:predicted ATPase/DNA-binding SARP family transcriptional activator